MGQKKVFGGRDVGTYYLPRCSTKRVPLIIIWWGKTPFTVLGAAAAAWLFLLLTTYSFLQCTVSGVLNSGWNTFSKILHMNAEPQKTIHNKSRKQSNVTRYTFVLFALLFISIKPLFICMWLRSACESNLSLFLWQWCYVVWYLLSSSVRCWIVKRVQSLMYSIANIGWILSDKLALSIIYYNTTQLHILLLQHGQKCSTYMYYHNSARV